MIDNQSLAFWRELIQLATANPIVIDRPKGQRHPRYPELIYPLDYGYLEGTSASDGGGIDVWLGSLGNKELTGILCTFDTLKRDAEIKLLLGCTSTDIETILKCYESDLRALYIPNPLES
jgi:inorganic pyrophosphatase